MPNPNPFDHLFEQVADILAMTHEYSRDDKKQKKFDDSIIDEIDQLEKGIELFRTITDEAIKRTGIDEELLEKAIQEPGKELSGKEKRILEKAKKLRGELSALEKEYAKKARIVKLQKKKSKTAGKKRKKKFKRLGGQGWMPL